MVLGAFRSFHVLVLTASIDQEFKALTVRAASPPQTL